MVVITFIDYVFSSCFHVFCFFFFKQKTAYEMRISDWSSDVCSSDLARGVFVAHHRKAARLLGLEPGLQQRRRARLIFVQSGGRQDSVVENEIGRASCRERVCQYV